MYYSPVTEETFGKEGHSDKHLGLSERVTMIDIFSQTDRIKQIYIQPMWMAIACTFHETFQHCTLIILSGPP